MSPRRRSRPGSVSGQGLVEFGLVLPLVIGLVFAGIDLGRFAYIKGSLDGTAQRAARVLALPSGQISDCNGLNAMVSAGNAISVVTDPKSYGDNGSGATVTYSSSTVTDTTSAWTLNAWATSVITAGNSTMTVASNTATVLTGGSWSSGTPAPGTAYSVEPVASAPPVGKGYAYISPAVAPTPPSPANCSPAGANRGTNISVKTRITYSFVPWTPFLSRLLGTKTITVYAAEPSEY